MKNKTLLPTPISVKLQKDGLSMQIIDLRQFLIEYCTRRETASYDYGSKLVVLVLNSNTSTRLQLNKRVFINIKIIQIHKKINNIFHFMLQHK